MSYRELRNFTEMMRTLGYPELLSMESFRTPNFPLVAEVLVWLSKRLDSDTEIPLTYSTEDERVELIRNVAQFMALKVNIKLNTKRLYQADGYAVKELLKISSLLYKALKSNDIKDICDEDENDMSLTLREFDISDKTNDLKQSRQLASEITTNGAKLYDLLGKEVDLRNLRHVSVSRQFEINEVESSLKQTITAVKAQINETKEQLNNMSNSKAALDAKIERRKTELDRYEKRLQTLKKVKPAFLEEFSKAEEELQELYEKYIVRYRCLIYLEQRADEVECIETERMQQHLIATRHMVEQLRLEEHLPEENSDLGEPEAEEPKKPERPRNKAESRNRALRSSKLYAPKNAESVLETSTPSSDSEDSDTVDNLLDGDEGDIHGSLLNSDDDSLALDISHVEKRAPTGRRTSTQRIVHNSDDDF